MLLKMVKFLEIKNEGKLGDFEVKACLKKEVKESKVEYYSMKVEISGGWMYVKVQR
jgi:hypothetical protein